MSPNPPLRLLLDFDDRIQRDRDQPPPPFSTAGIGALLWTANSRE